MKENKKTECELSAELESANQKVEKIEAQLKEQANEEGNKAEQYQTMSDVRESEIRYRRLFETSDP
jgi:hypothetical protein